MPEHTFNQPVGTLPILQYMPPAQLLVDATYQRELETRTSKKLIAEIAEEWDWTLCLPLVVSRRPDQSFYVVDGQHRHAAALKRGDIQVLPCVIFAAGSVELEAQTFVRLNKKRRPISKLDEFRAAIASGDPEATQISLALAEANLTVAKNTNPSSWQPGDVANIAGVERAWRDYGPEASSLALQVVSRAFDGKKLQYFGSIYPGTVVAIADQEGDFEYVDQLVAMLSSRPQEEWRKAILLHLADNPGTSPRSASIDVVTDAWDEVIGGLLADQLEEAA